MIRVTQSSCRYMQSSHVFQGSWWCLDQHRLGLGAIGGGGRGLTGLPRVVVRFPYHFSSSGLPHPSHRSCRESSSGLRKCGRNLGEILVRPVATGVDWSLPAMEKGVGECVSQSGGVASSIRQPKRRNPRKSEQMRAGG